MLDFILSHFTIPELSMIGISTYVLGGMVRLYVMFVLGFSLKDKIGRYFLGKIILLPLFLIGFIYDIWLNWWISIPTKDLPYTWNETITQRMKRYKLNEPHTWKGRVSFWICEKLNKYDKGHC